MSSIGIIIKGGLKITTKVPKPKFELFEAQLKVLTKLLRKAQFTDFGQEYNFTELLYTPYNEERIQIFQNTVPIHTYETIFNRWWKNALTGEKNITWPGKVPYWALSSGTSAGASKYIPVTKTMLRSIQRASLLQWASLGNCDLPESFYEKAILMLGGSTSLEYNGIHYAGDLSGITTGNIPFWFQPYYKPGKEISQTKSWQDKLDKITTQAHKWDVSGIAGNPAWFQILIERIIEHYQVKNIHEVWPNLQVFTHGAVAFDPYRKSFESLLGHPLIYLETYLASEGFIAYQDRPNTNGMKMLVRNGIFYEFIPYTPENIDLDGQVNTNAIALNFNQVQENVDYILLISTVAGTWRYILGDVIRFVDLPNREIKIMGRTKFYLSLVGEHLSVENLNKAIELTSEDLDINIKEFTVIGVKEENRFAHHWFLSTDSLSIDKDKVIERIDHHLKVLNDDYSVERGHGIKSLYIDILPNQMFFDWLKADGKEGAQIKFPRVLKGTRAESWRQFVETNCELKINTPV